jgi:hypothetical protein
MYSTVLYVKESRSLERGKGFTPVLTRRNNGYANPAGVVEPLHLDAARVEVV